MRNKTDYFLKPRFTCRNKNEENFRNQNLQASNYKMEIRDID